MLEDGTIMVDEGTTWVTKRTSKICCCTSSALDRLKVTEKLPNTSPVQLNAAC